MYINSESIYAIKGYESGSPSKLSPAGEDCLEMIYRHSLINEYVRINFLAARLNVNPTAASKTVQHLKELGLTNFEKYGLISLTQGGREMGEYLLFRHNIIHSFLCHVNSSTNELKQTELIEHYIDKRTVNNIEKLINEMENKV